MGNQKGQILSEKEVLQSISEQEKSKFKVNRRVLSFDEYLGLVSEHPRRHLRGSAQYLVEMLEFFGKTPVSAAHYTEEDGQIYRFHLFDYAVDGIAAKVVGQEQVQTQIYRSLKSFVRQGANNQLILLHGPNGSAKSTLVRALMGGMERYSKEEDGATYTFSWVFPIEKITKGAIGINPYDTPNEGQGSFAHLPDEDVAVRIPCDLKDHPFLLIPLAQRKDTLEKLIGRDEAEKIWPNLPYYLKEGDLSHLSKQIFESLLLTNDGDLMKVFRHIQVERQYFSRRYRKGLTTIEPQLHVDAQYNQLTYNRNLASLPAALQSLNFFALTGDLIDGNRGIVEFSDLLKRPIDSFKYLLIACETGSVTVGLSIAYLDTVMLGSTNELQLDSFKEFPDFSSFKARIELIRTPYLLSVHEEEEIYSLLLPQISGEKHVAPHVAWTLALWAVLTRLKKPNSASYPSTIAPIISKLTPIEKARIYDTGQPLESLTVEERRLLRSNLPKLRREYANIPYYEGRIGASVREVKGILFEAAQNQSMKCLSPLSVLHELERFVKKVSEYEFLKQEIKDNYHDAKGFIQTVRNEYGNILDREVRESLGLYKAQQWEEFIRRYITHLSSLLKKEKINNPITGKSEDPDKSLIAEFEKIVKAPASESQLQGFRQGIISQVGAWSLDHPNEPVVYQTVFPEFWKKLESHYYESQKGVLTKMHNALLVYDTEEDDPNSEGGKLVREVLTNMVSKLNYCENCAKEAIHFLMKNRY